MSNQIYDPKNARIGFGTQNLRDLEILTSYLKELSKHHYDFIDCAWRYGNEAIIGLALKGIKREMASFELNLLFQSKVWPTQFFGGITKSLKFTLQKIGAFNSIHSYMLHRPAHDMALNLSAWKQLIECKKNRLARNIGLGHFDKDLIEELFKATGVRPQYLQIELNVNNMRWDRIAYCRERDIELQAYEPLGQYQENLKNPILIRLAEKYKTNIKNLLIAYLLNQSITVVVTPDTVEEIADILKSKDIVLSGEDIEEMKTLNTYRNKCFESIELDFKDE